MLPELTPDEARVIGALIEKSIVTPDQYPLTLNALTNACNQKSARNPVTSYTQGEVQHLTRVLASKRYLRIEENFRSSVEKYTQIFCNTRYNEFKFDDAGLAIICVLLLRGAQTPGELRTNTRRLHEFGDNEAVIDTLKRLGEHPQGALVVRLPRTPGRRDSEYMHAFFGDIADTGSVDDEPPARRSAPAAASDRPGSSSLEERVTRLEREIADLKSRLGET